MWKLCEIFSDMSIAEAAPQSGIIPADTFGTRLAVVRQHMAWTNVRMAETECGFTRAKWAGWERGKSPHNMHEVVSTIARRTGISREWLMWGGPLTQTDNMEAPTRGFAGSRSPEYAPVHVLPVAACQASAVDLRRAA